MPRSTQHTTTAVRTSCKLESCSRPVAKPDQYQYCDVMCSRLDRLLSEVERTVREVDHPETGELWSAAVAAVDAVCDVVRMRARVWRQATAVS